MNETRWRDGKPLTLGANDVSKFENRSLEERQMLEKENWIKREAEVNRQTISSLHSESVKHDGDKPAVQYIPKEAMFAMGEAFAHGAKKYNSWNYAESGLEISRCLGAAIRHVYQYLDGENLDQESMKSHLGHAMAAIAMAIYMEKNHPNKDDRFKKKTK